MVTATWEFGFARQDITAWEPGLAMMGWGQPDNLIDGVAEPLHARAVVLRHADGGKVAIVVVELMMMTNAVRTEVLDRLQRDHAELGFDARNVVLSATHTHSGPSGFSHYIWLNLAGPGYSDIVFQTVVDGIVTGIVTAHERLQPGALHLAQTVIDADENIAFNRAVESYNLNADVEPVTDEDRADAADRLMTIIRFDDLEGRAVGMLNWFGVHGTSIHAENRLLHPDNKGLAAVAFEADGLFSVFCQEATGDITPNYRYDAARKKVIGRYDDDFESAAHVGEVQCRYAQKLMDEARQGVALTGGLSVVTRNVDFGQATVDEQWAREGADAQTGKATVGISMAMGTAEGPGPLKDHRWFTRILNGAVSGLDRVRGWGAGRTFDPKFPLLDLGAGLEGRLLGTFSLRKMGLPNVDPVVGYMKGLVADGAMSEASWIGEVVTLQVVCIGPLAIAALPFEMTTVAARRLRQTLRDELADAGVTEVVLQTYANSYVGYMTTWEEYQLQGYEGGYTLFGPWSLAALRTAFSGLARDVVAGKSSPLGPMPFRFEASEIERRQYSQAWGPHGATGPRASNGQ